MTSFRIGPPRRYPGGARPRRNKVRPAVRWTRLRLGRMPEARGGTLREIQRSPEWRLTPGGVYVPADFGAPHELDTP